MDPGKVELLSAGGGERGLQDGGSQLEDSEGV